MATFSEIEEAIMLFLYGPGWVTWSFAWILCIYAALTAWSIFYDLACKCISRFPVLVLLRVLASGVLLPKYMGSERRDNVHE